MGNKHDKPGLPTIEQATEPNVDINKGSQPINGRNSNEAHDNHGTVATIQGELKETQGDNTEGWVTISLATQDALVFNPQTSYTLCAGVGRQLKMDTGHLGVAADNDANLIHSVLHQKFDIPEKNSTLLSSEKEKQATLENIQCELRAKSQLVGKDGILVFQFSGHCYKLQTGEVLLAPADCMRTRSTTLTIQDIINCIQGTIASYFVMIVDCCYAELVAEQFILKWETLVPTYILASCSSKQKSLSFKDLKNGFFTYFLVKYFEDYKERTFPTLTAVDYCKPLCAAMSTLVSPGYGADAEMSPKAVFCNIQVLEERVLVHTGAVDDIDFTQQTYPYDFAVKYLMLDQAIGKGCSLPEVPQAVKVWLMNDATPAMEKLKGASLIHLPEMFSTVMAFLAQSVAKLMYKDALDSTGSHELIFRSDWFILAFIRVSEALSHVDESLQPELKDMEHFLEYYTTKVKWMTEEDWRSEDLTELIDLLNKVSRDNRMAQQGKQPVDESDQLDGSLKEQIYMTLESIQEEMKATFLPPLLGDH
ncbi:unnamed protein product [Owenia fusiformis]|uniref:Peptidase C14 caspase domain-containing protein n=1 Tax=Owenia fusiformis TaxID=6347 RepID=A0A8J1UWP2_OWEFU|nr:unnamed protein product [Owenia fusiformis]